MPSFIWYKRIPEGGIEMMKTKRFWALLSACVLLLSLACFPAHAESGNYAVVAGTDTLNLRSTPSADSQWLGRAYRGDWVEILSTESNGWHYCRVVSTGKYGFMAGNYLQVQSGVNSNNSVGVVKNPVSTQYLNLRQYPSYSAPVLGRYYNGAQFTILSVQDGWYHVKVSGQEGYFRSEYVQVNGGAAVSSAVVRTGNSGKLNLRNAPSANGGIIAQYANGTQVDVLLKGNLYWKVSVNGKTGYMDPAFLTDRVNSGSSASGSTASVPKTKGYVIVNNPRATQYLNLRAQPSTSSKVIAQYYNGIRLEVIEQGETWCKVYGKASGNIGYVMTKYVTLYGLSGTPTKTVNNGNTFVNLRSAPSKATGNVYQKVYSGSQVTVLTPGDEWTQVRYGNTVGYMMTCFLK